MQKPELELTQIQQKLAESLQSFEKMHINTINQSHVLYSNVSKIIPLFIRVAHKSMKSFIVLLRFLSDKEIMTMGLTCKSFYRLIYSPLGYRIMNIGRPITVKVQKKKQGPIITKKQIQNLCNDKSLVDMDDDDKQAFIITMQSNLIATKQKVAQLDDLINTYDKNSDAVLQQISYIGGMRDEQMQRKQNIRQDIEKLEQLMKESEKNVIMLKQEQQKMLHQRNTRLVILQTQKNKLQHHKNLLIKKVKSQQKQKQEGMMHAREVNRILERLNKIIGPKKN